jgi:membrane protein
MPIATLWHVILRAIQDWWNDNCLRLAASLAYYTALSLAPLVLLIVGVVGLVLDRQQAIHQLTAQLEGLMGASGRELVTSILTSTSPQEGALATVVGLVTLLIGATAVFGELQATMNLIWEVQPAPTSGIWAGIWAWLRERVFSLAIVFALAFLLLVSLVISTALATVAALFHGPEQALLSRLLELAVSLLVLTFVFALLYKYVPDAEIGWRDVWLGGLSLRRGRVDGGAPRMGLLLGPDHVFWRRVHARLGHAPWQRDPAVTCRFRGSTPDQKRGDQRSPFEVMTLSVGSLK